MYLLKYAVIKFIKSPSTWLIIFLGIVVAGVVAGWLPAKMGTKDLSANEGMQSDQTLKSIVLRSLIAVGGSLGMFSAIFAGFKGAQVFRNEVEDGTFLIMLSKPNSRRKVIFIKWLSFILFMVIFQLIIIAAHNIGIIIGDETKTIAKKFLRYTFLTELALGILLGFIFSSVALLISTFATSGGTIGTSMVLGLAIPITGILSLFTYQPGFLPATRRSKSDIFNQAMSVARDSFLDVNDLPSMDDIDDYEEYTSKEQLYFDTEKGTYTYKKLAWLDFNYQIAQLMTLATDKILSKQEQDVIAGASLGRVGTISYLQKSTGTIDRTFYNNKIIEKNKELDVGIEDIRNQFDSFLTPEVVKDIKKGFDLIFDNIGNSNTLKNKKLPQWINDKFEDTPADQFVVRYDENNFENILKNSKPNPSDQGNIYYHNPSNASMEPLTRQLLCKDQVIIGVTPEERKLEAQKYLKTHPKLSIFEFYCNLFENNTVNTALGNGIPEFIKKIWDQQEKWSSLGDEFFQTLQKWENTSNSIIVKFVKSQIGLDPSLTVNRLIEDNDKILYMTAFPILFLSNYLTKETEYLIDLLTPYANNFHEVKSADFAEMMIDAVNASILAEDKSNQLNRQMIMELIDAGQTGIEGRRLPSWWTKLVDDAGASNPSMLEDEVINIDKSASTTNNKLYSYENIIKALIDSKQVHKVEYVPFLQPLNILWFYIGLSILLVPISYYIVSRQNFR